MKSVINWNAHRPREPALTRARVGPRWPEMERDWDFRLVDRGGPPLTSMGKPSQMLSLRMRDEFSPWKALRACYGRVLVNDQHSAMTEVDLDRRSDGCS